MSDTREVRNLKKQVSTQQKQLAAQEKESAKQKKELNEQKAKTKELEAEHRKLKRAVQKHADLYVVEMKKALSTAILAAFAFLMALSWREYITEVIDSILIYSPVQGKLISALLVTVISVFGIVIVTRYLQPEQA